MKGSASLHINKVESPKEIEVLYDLHDNLMLQEYMKRQKNGEDDYIEMISGKSISMFLKKKIKMRS